MNKKAVISNVIISVILNLIFGSLLISAGVLVLIFPQILGIVLNSAYALIGLILILTSIPNLVSGIASFKQKKGKFDLIFSIVTIVIGVVLAMYGLISVLLTIGIDLIQMPRIISILMNVLRWLLCGLIALYLIVLPIIRIVKAEKKWMQFKAELIKIILGVLLVVLLILGVLVSLINSIAGILLIVFGALTVLLAILHLIIGLIGLGKKTPEARVAVAVDVNGDGKADAVWVDTDGDGKVDAVLADTDGDGTVDTVLADIDGDGQVDAVALDVDGDGTIDVVGITQEAPAKQQEQENTQA